MPGIHTESRVLGGKEYTEMKLLFTLTGAPHVGLA